MQEYFDPKTGELIGGDIGGPSQAPSQSPIPQPPKKKHGLLWLGIGGGVVLLAGVIAAVVLISGMFSNPLTKISTAMVNTFKETSQLQKDIDFRNFITDGNARIELSMEVDHDTVNAVYMYDLSNKRKAASLKLDVDAYEEFSFDLTAEIDKERLAFTLAPFSDDLYTYYYTADNDGYLVDIIEDELDIDIEEFNSVFKNIYDMDYKANTDIFEILGKAALEEIKNIEIEKVKNKEFEVNGKKQSCTGYSLTITRKNAKKVLSAIEKAGKAELGDLWDDYDFIIDEIFGELEDLIDDLEDVDITFYIYKNQIACINLEADRTTLDILFLGGDYPTQNIEVILDDGRYYDEETILEVTGKRKDNVETIEVAAFDESLFEIKYDTKSGQIEFESDSADVEFEGTLKRTKSELTFEIEIDYYDDVSVVLTISDDGTIKALKGKEFDLGNADDDDLEDLAEDFYDEFYDLLWYIF